MNENNKNNNDPIIFIIFILLSEMILPLSKCASDYDFRIDDNPEYEFQATETRLYTKIHWGRNIGIDRNPWTDKYRGEAAPNDIPCCLKHGYRWQAKSVNNNFNFQ